MSRKKKILFIAPHRRGRAPSQRFRFEQYLEFLSENGFEYEFSELLDEEDDKLFYKGNLTDKLRIYLKGKRRRKADVLKSRSVDIVFIQREGFMTGSTRFEKMFFESGAKVIYDFDDAIWKMDVSAGNRMLRFLKDPAKTSKLIAMSHLVFAGNAYLAGFAKQFNKNVVIVPTTIDTSVYKRIPIKKDKITIGWSGSLTTIKHFEYAIGFLEKVKAKYGQRITIKVIGDGTYRNKKLGITGIPWVEKDEVKELSEFDIGIMPLPDDEWAKGKCALKGLQYMALGIPAIMSPVGVNTEIIQDGVNGFLASSESEWLEKLELLIGNEGLRHSIGVKAMETVEEKYSVNAWKGKYLDLMSELIRNNSRS